MFLHPPPPTQAAERLYENDRGATGYVMNLTRAWAWRPDVTEAFAELRRAVTTPSSLTPREVAVIVCATAATLGDAYCALAWGTRLAKEADAAMAAAVLADQISDSLSARERALAGWARRLVRNPNSTTANDVAGLRAAGLSDGDIFDATVLAALRLAFSTVNDALGVAPDAQIARAAPALVREAVRFGRPSDEVIASTPTATPPRSLT
jgi:uncharacterized peroxidase-related enzyme